jgi:hypothetical protein
MQTGPTDPNKSMKTWSRLICFYVHRSHEIRTQVVRMRRAVSSCRTIAATMAAASRLGLDPWLKADCLGVDLCELIGLNTRPDVV